MSKKMSKTKTKVLILGSTGMLGSLVSHYFKHETTYDVAVTGRAGKTAGGHEFDAEDFLVHPEKYDFLKNYDYIINCIGIIKPFCPDHDEKGVLRAIKVNAHFPHALGTYLADASTRVLQIATDCVYSGKEGQYKESAKHDPLDVYGKTKSLGEAQFANMLHIRSSIIGPEMGSSLSLLEWFLHQPAKATVQGFSHHLWNGVTTLQFAQVCDTIIQKNLFEELRSESLVHHFLPNSTVNKYELLNIFKDVFARDILIEEVDNVGPRVERTLDTELKLLKQQYQDQPMKQALTDLAKYMQKYKLSLYAN